MMTAVVVGVFTKLVGNSTVKPFFDGSVPCQSRDFVDNKIIQGALVTQLVAFFGSAGVLGCTDGGFPQYTGNTDMGVVHQYMPITEAIFDAFVTTLVNVVTNALKDDVPSLNSDLAGVGALLYSPGVYVICNQPDCNMANAANPSVYIDKLKVMPPLCATNPPPVTTTTTTTAAPTNPGDTTTTTTTTTTGTGTPAASGTGTPAASGTTLVGTTPSINNNPPPTSADAATAVFSAVVVLLGTLALIL